MKERALTAWRECGFVDDERMTKKHFLDDVRSEKFFAVFKDEICRNSREKFSLAISYMKQEGLHGSVGIVDIGWACTMQKYLEDFLSFSGIEADIHGYYLGLKPETFVSSNFESYIPARLNPSLFCSVLMEYPFTQVTGSTKTYAQAENGQVIPVLYDYEFAGTADEECTRNIQKGALDFISIMNDGYGTEHVDFSIAYAKLRKITKSPSLKDIFLLGGLRFVNHSQMSHMANPQSLMHYLFHTGHLKQDLSRSGWKAGFIRRLVMIPLPYSKILSVIRRKLERKYK